MRNAGRPGEAESAFPSRASSALALRAHLRILTASADRMLLESTTCLVDFRPAPALLPRGLFLRRARSPAAARTASPSPSLGAGRAPPPEFARLWGGGRWGGPWRAPPAAASARIWLRVAALSAGRSGRVSWGRLSSAPARRRGRPTQPRSHPREAYKKPQQLGTGHRRPTRQASPASLQLAPPSAFRGRSRPSSLSLLSLEGAAPASAPWPTRKGRRLRWPCTCVATTPRHPLRDRGPRRHGRQRKGWTLGLAPAHRALGLS